MQILKQGDELRVHVVHPQHPPQGPAIDGVVGLGQVNVCHRQAGVVHAARCTQSAQSVDGVNSAPAAPEATLSLAQLALDLLVNTVQQDGCIDLAWDGQQADAPVAARLISGAFALVQRHDKGPLPLNRRPPRPPHSHHHPVQPLHHFRPSLQLPGIDQVCPRRSVVTQRFHALCNLSQSRLVAGTLGALTRHMQRLEHQHLSLNGLALRLRQLGPAAQHLVKVGGECLLHPALAIARALR